MPILQSDAKKIQEFEQALQQRCNPLGIPLRFAGEKEEGNPPYLYFRRYQLGVEQFELFINLREMEDENRYGYVRLGLAF